MLEDYIDFIKIVEEYSKEIRAYLHSFAPQAEKPLTSEWCVSYQYQLGDLRFYAESLLLRPDFESFVSFALYAHRQSKLANQWCKLVDDKLAELMGRDYFEHLCEELQGTCIYRWDCRDWRDWVLLNANEMGSAACSLEEKSTYMGRALASLTIEKQREAEAKSTVISKLNQENKKLRLKSKTR